MKKKMMMLSAMILMGYIYLLPSPAQSLSGGVHSDKKVALSYLQQSEKSYIEGNWKIAASFADMGIAYDSTIADLWYIKAVCAKQLYAPVSEILPFISRAAVSTHWIGDKKLEAIVMYADILSDTGNSLLALEVLEPVAEVISADIRYVQLKALYRMNTEESRQKAREAVYQDCRLFPADYRFARLFFQMETATIGSPQFDEIKQTAQIFINRIDAESPDAELEIYAILFSPADEQLLKLQSFAARGQKHYLYAPLALRHGLLDEKAAVDYVIDFLEEAVPYDFFIQFAVQLQDAEAKDAMKSVMTAFSGQLTEDTDGDGIYNLYVKYERGRAVQITYDINQDGLAELSADCDFGLPTVVIDNRSDFIIHYNHFPTVREVEVLKLLEDNYLVYTFDGVPFEWNPFIISKSLEIAAAYDDFAFYFPYIDTGTSVQKLDQTILLKEATAVDTTVSQLGKTLRIHFSVLDGKYTYAEYILDETPYAHAYFSDGILDKRYLDNDGDGHFERCEVFDLVMASETEGLVHADAALYKGLFGAATMPNGIYLKQVLIDTNKDVVPDFIQSYSEDGIVMASWDTDYDGNWNTRYVSYPNSDIEDIYYYRPREKSAVCIRSRAKVPIKLIDGTIEYPIVKDPVCELYWIGDTKGTNFAAEVLSALSLIQSEGVCTIVPAGEDRILAVRVGDFCFGELIDKSDETDVQ